jgi:hypothetical protein
VIPLLQDLARCVGHGAGPSGHQLRVDCVHCARRLAPRAGDVPWVEPEPMFPCPNRIPVEVKE